MLKKIAILSAAANNNYNLANANNNLFEAAEWKDSSPFCVDETAVLSVVANNNYNFANANNNLFEVTECNDSSPFCVDETAVLSAAANNNIFEVAECNNGSPFYVYEVNTQQSNEFDVQKENSNGSSDQAAAETNGSQKEKSERKHSNNKNNTINYNALAIAISVAENKAYELTVFFKKIAVIFLNNMCNLLKILTKLTINIINKLYNTANFLIKHWKLILLGTIALSVISTAIILNAPTAITSFVLSKKFLCTITASLTALSCVSIIKSRTKIQQVNN